MLEAKAGRRTSKELSAVLLRCKERAAPGELFPPAKRKLASIFPEALRRFWRFSKTFENGHEAFTEWMLVELEEVPGEITWSSRSASRILVTG